MIIGKRGVSAGRTGPEVILGTRPFLRIGDLSFSIYLWHWPILTSQGRAGPGFTIREPCAPAGRPGLALAGRVCAGRRCFRRGGRVTVTAFS
jgi:peptidoglycan/LPS O-acetylase OafA/YrhL